MIVLDEKSVNTQYKDLLARILKEGVRAFKQQSKHSEDGKGDAITLVGHQMRFDLRREFPMITERDLLSQGKTFPMYEMALNELFAFLHGARTVKELEEWNVPWWKKWANPEKCAKRGLKEGDLGPGSYGPAWRSFPTAEGESFDQIGMILQQMKEKPHLRTHCVFPWIPQYVVRVEGRQQKVVVVPCHGYFHVFLFPETNELVLHHFQRSADVPVGLVFNLIQYAALAMMFAQVLGYVAKELVYTISDAHIYVGQLDKVEKLLATEPQPLPRVHIDPSVKNLMDFRTSHFTFSDYFPQNGRMAIWTPE